MKFAIVVKSTLVTHDDAYLWADACRTQLNLDCAPAWEMAPTAKVIVRFRLRDVPAGYWPVVLFDDSDQAGALGYHDEDPKGRPYGRVFVKTCQTYDVPVSSVLSHELLEAFIDPHVNLWADKGDGTQFALEVGDPVENRSYDILVKSSSTTVGGPVTVWDFVYPAYFDSRRPLNAPTSHLTPHPVPFSTADGYAIVRQAGGETTIAGRPAQWRANNPGHRTELRSAVARGDAR